MPYPHRIRLRGPWECRVLEARGQHTVPAPRKVTVPCRLSDCGLAGFQGNVRFTRKFGYPGQIDAFERVWLTCGGLEGKANIAINGQMIVQKRNGAFEFDISRFLEPHNLLEVTLSAENDQAGIWGEVGLEIRCAAYLRDVEASPTISGEVLVEGKLFGYSEQALDLYVLVDGKNVAYQSITPGQLARPFQIILPEQPKDSQTIRIDLACGAVIWHTAEVPKPNLPTITT